MTPFTRIRHPLIPVLRDSSVWMRAHPEPLRPATRVYVVEIQEPTLTEPYHALAGFVDLTDKGANAAAAMSFAMRIRAETSDQSQKPGLYSHHLRRIVAEPNTELFAFRMAECLWGHKTREVLLDLYSPNRLALIRTAKEAVETHGP